MAKCEWIKSLIFFVCLFLQMCLNLNVLYYKITGKKNDVCFFCKTQIPDDDNYDEWIETETHIGHDDVITDHTHTHT